MLPNKKIIVLFKELSNLQVKITQFKFHAKVSLTSNQLSIAFLLIPKPKKMRMRINNYELMSFITINY